MITLENNFVLPSIFPHCSAFKNAYPTKKRYRKDFLTFCDEFVYMAFASIVSYAFIVAVAAWAASISVAKSRVAPTSWWYGGTRQTIGQFLQSKSRDWYISQ